MIESETIYTINCDNCSLSMKASSPKLPDDWGYFFIQTVKERKTKEDNLDYWLDGSWRRSAMEIFCPSCMKKVYSVLKEEEDGFDYTDL